MLWTNKRDRSRAFGHPEIDAVGDPMTIGDEATKGEIEMTTTFGATSTTDDVLTGVDLRGKRILVTGVSAGLVVETARALTAHGAQVVGAARDLVKAKAATEPVRKDADANDWIFELVELVLANLKSVRACAEGLLAKGEPFDVIIANAGVMATPFGRTADGFETQFWHQSSWSLRLFKSARRAEPTRCDISHSWLMLR